MTAKLEFHPGRNTGYVTVTVDPNEPAQDLFDGITRAYALLSMRGYRSALRLLDEDGLVVRRPLANPDDLTIILCGDRP